MLGLPTPIRIPAPTRAARPRISSRASGRAPRGARTCGRPARQRPSGCARARRIHWRRAPAAARRRGCPSCCSLSASVPGGTAAGAHWMAGGAARPGGGPRARAAPGAGGSLDGRAAGAARRHVADGLGQALRRGARPAASSLARAPTPRDGLSHSREPARRLFSFRGIDCHTHCRHGL